MFRRLINFEIKFMGSSGALAVGFALLGGIVFTDYITAYELALTPFYLFVVLFIAWNCGWKWGLVFCLLCFAAGFEVGDELGHPYSESIYFYIENGNRLISYLVSMVLAAKVRGQHLREKNSARVDYLTGVLNQKGFYESLGIEMKRHRRERAPLSIAYLDCDNFKQVNDRFGHKEGDRLLAEIAQTMKSNLRQTDLVARLGGDEFAVVLEKSDRDQAARAIENLRKSLEACMSRYDWPVTFSIGIGVFRVLPELEDEIIAFADGLMYQVKTSGKNNVLIKIFEPAQTSGMRPR